MTTPAPGTGAHGSDLEREQPITEAEVQATMSWGDGALGAAGHSVEDEAAREIMRERIRGNITSAEAKRQLAFGALGYIPDSMKDEQ